MVKKIIILLLILVALLIILGVWLGYNLSRADGAGGVSPYSAVYLRTGDIYFGKLSWFPKPRLKNVWFIQRSVDEKNQPQLGLLPFTSAFWGPIDEVSLNPAEIVFWTRLRGSSDAARAFANPGAFRAPPAPEARDGTSPSGSE